MTSLRGVAIVAAALGFASASAGAPAPDAAPAAPVKMSDIVGSTFAGARVADALLDVAAKKIAYLIVDSNGRQLACAYPTGATLKAKVLSADGASTTGCSALSETGVPPGLHAESSMIDTPLRDREGEPVGKVKDFFVDPRTGALTHAVTAFDPQWYTSTGWVAVPMEKLASANDAFVARFAKGDLHPLNPPSAKTASASSAAPPPAPMPHDERVALWLGRKVRDAAGKDVGQVVDLLLDPQRQTGAIALVAAGGPPSACALGPQGLHADGDHFVMPANHAGCGAAPSDGDGSGRLSAKKLLQPRVRSASERKDVGVLKDVVVNAHDGRLHYFVVDFDSSWVQDGKLNLLPARALQRKGDRMWLQAELSDLEKWPMIDEKRLDDVSAPSFAKAMDQYLARDAAAAPHS